MATAMVVSLSRRNQHLGELPADQRGARLVLGDELRDHVLLAPALVLVDDTAARADARADADRLEELELHLGVQPRMHRVAAVPQPQGLVGRERRMRDGAAEGRGAREPRVMIVDGERVGLDVLGRDELRVGDELLADAQGLVRQQGKVRHGAGFYHRTVAYFARFSARPRGGPAMRTRRAFVRSTGRAAAGLAAMLAARRAPAAWAAREISL